MSNVRAMLVCGLVLGLVAVRAQADDQTSLGTNSSDAQLTRDNANKIEKALQSTTQCDFADTPLEAAMGTLSKHHHIDIWIDKGALSDEGINTDQQVTLASSDITLAVAFRLILEPMGLTYLNDDGMVKITTQAVADEIMSTRIYPVGDLVNQEYEPLMKVIQESTSTKWMNIDQEGGAINSFRNARSLVIRQNQKAHREIEGLLSALREAKRLQNVSSIPTRSEDASSLAHGPMRVPPRNRATRPRPQHMSPGNQPQRFLSAGG